MILAAHQPNFMPWCGYFDKMQKADLFVSVDHVQMERSSYQNRTQIKTGEGSCWITVPVIQDSRDELLMNKRIDNSRDGRFRWSRKMLLTLKYAYQAAPYYRVWEPVFSDVLEARWERLCDLNEKLIELCRQALDIRTPMLKSSELNIKGAKSDMVLNLCREVGADAYLAGSGASRVYLDVPAFERAGIRVLWQDLKQPQYRQYPVPENFIESLSAIDLILNNGPRSSALLRNNSSASAETSEPYAEVVLA